MFKNFEKTYMLIATDLGTGLCVASVFGHRGLRVVSPEIDSSDDTHILLVRTTKRKFKKVLKHSYIREAVNRSKLLVMPF